MDGFRGTPKLVVAALLAAAPSVLDERAAAASLSPADAELSRRSVSLSWQAARGCPNRSWVLLRVDAFLGRPAAEAATTDVVASARVEQTSLGYAGRLRWTAGDASDQRELGDPDCLVVADALAFVLASAIDPLASYASAAPLEREAPVPVAGVPPPRQVEASSPLADTGADEPAERRESSSRPRWALGPLLGVGYGLHPDVSPVVGGVGELRIGSFRSSMAMFWGFSESGVEPGASGTASFQSVAAWIEACWLLLERGAEVPLCARFEGGALRGAGEGVSDPDVSWLPWLALGSSASLSFSLRDDFALRFGGSVAPALVRPRFILAESTIHETRPVIIDAEVSVEWRFP